MRPTCRANHCSAGFDRLFIVGRCRQPMNAKTKMPGMHIFLMGLVLALSLGIVRGEQIRMVVTAPVVGGETNGVGGEVALWQALITTELSRQSAVAVLEREDLSKLAAEQALIAGHTTNSTAAAGWLGADCVMLTQWQVKNGTNRLAIKILDVGQGGIEKEFNREFAEDQMAAAAGDLAKELRAIGLEMLSRRQIHTAVSVLDFESQSRFERGRWQERALARQLRAFLKQQPGVLVLEREDVEALLRETRLQRGGLAAAGTALTNAWAALRHYPLVSGTIVETQPEGSPLTLRITTQIGDLGDGRTNAFTESFPVEQWAAGVEIIEKQLNQFLRDGESAATGSSAVPDRSAEAMALANKALGLSTQPQLTNLKALTQHSPSGLLSWSDLAMFFSARTVDGNGYGVMTAWRKARILQACQYLKAAVLVDDRNPQIKLLLASFLTDPQVNESDLAVELAEEVGWQFPELRLAAWSHAYNHSGGETQERLLRLLIRYFPDSEFAHIPTQREFEAFIQNHRGDSDLTVLIDRLRPELDRVIAGNQAGINLEGDVKRLFELTQIAPANPNEPWQTPGLQTPENQARGVVLLEEMIWKHPAQAFFLCHFWSKCWDDYRPDDSQAWYWFRRAAEVTPPGKLTAGGNNNWWDHRLKMVQRLMDRHEYKDALYFLEKINQQDLLEGNRDMMLAQCCFELGDYQRALTVFQTFGPDNKEAAEWATKCEDKLGITPPAAPPKPYATVINKVDWGTVDIPGVFVTNMMTIGGRSRSVSINLGSVHALVADTNYLWLGYIPRETERDTTFEQRQSFLDSEQNKFKQQMTLQIRQLTALQGGLLRWDRTTGETQMMPLPEGPSRWIWTLAATEQGVWVGTYGGGLELLDRQNGQLKVWTETNGLPMNFVRSLAADADGLWVGLGYLNRGTVARLNLQDQTWRNFLASDYPTKTNFPTATDALLKLPEYMTHPVVISYVPITPATTVQPVDGKIWCILPGTQKEGCIWVSDRSHPVPVKVVKANFEPHGMVEFDKAANAWRPISDDAPAGLTRIGNRIWCSFGGGGLANCDLSGGDWQHITRAEGLPFDPAALCEWHGRLLIAGEGLMILDEEHKRFEVYPFPTPGGAGLMTLVGDQVYLVRGNQILSLDLATGRQPSPAKPMRAR